MGKVRTAVGLHSVTIATINPHTHLNPVCTVLLVTAHAVYGPTSRHTRASCRCGCCHLPPSAGFSLAYTCHQLTMTLYTGVSQKCSRTDRYTTTKSIEGYQLHPSHTATSTTHTYGPITIAIRARFEYDSSSIRLQHATTRYEMRTIRVRFERDTTSYEELCAFEQ